MHSHTLLQLIWLASPALPVGGYSYSEGLEAAVEAGLVHDEASLGQWLLDQQQLSLTRSDLPLLADALQAWQRHDTAQLAALNQWHHATRESHELRRQGEQMGRSMAEWLYQRAAGDERLNTLRALSPAPAWPLAFALAAARRDANARDTLLCFGFAWCENMVQAALKAMQLGQSAGQRVLQSLADALPPLVDQALQTTPEARQCFAPMAAILSARHETQYSRLFRS